MHYCNKCLSSIPNHLPDEKICSRCIAEDELETENERLREALEHLYELHASRKFVLQDEDYGAIARAAVALHKAEGRREE